MPRGRKKKPETVAEQIALIQEEINNLTAQLKDKKKELAELEKRQEAEQGQQLIEAVHASGKTIKEVIAMLNN